MWFTVIISWTHNGVSVRLGTCWPWLPLPCLISQRGKSYTSLRLSPKINSAGISLCGQHRGVLHHPHFIAIVALNPHDIAGQIHHPGFSRWGNWGQRDLKLWGQKWPSWALSPCQFWVQKPQASTMLPFSVIQEQSCGRMQTGLACNTTVLTLPCQRPCAHDELVTPTFRWQE